MRPLLYLIGAVLFSALCLAALLFVPPFETDEVFYPQVFVVSEGEHVRRVAESLGDRGLISSPTLFIIVNRIIGGKIRWGSYHIAEPRSIVSLARDLYIGDRNAHVHRVVIPEGSDLYAVADIFAEAFPHFDRETFAETALESHGYLYPDTYFLADDDIHTDRLISIMTETFGRRTGDLFESYTGDLTRDEIVTLASIVELEAHRFEDRRKIAGVLFNRLSINLPLQVDVSFLFISGKNTFALSRDDLNTVDPSNTYRYAGIPPIPITNPSRESIAAVLDPVGSDALFFLADFYGNTHFSTTYGEHLRKKAVHIDRVVRNRAGGSDGAADSAAGNGGSGAVVRDEPVPDGEGSDTHSADGGASGAGGGDGGVDGTGDGDGAGGAESGGGE